jgi:hypothetical protein
MEPEKDPPGSTNKTQSQCFGVVARCLPGMRERAKKINASPARSRFHFFKKQEA